jgi:hypothetical protein
MKDGFYWGTLLLEIEGEKSGVVFVRDGVGYLNGWAFLLTAYDFGSNPEQVIPPQWLIDIKLKQQQDQQ